MRRLLPFFVLLLSAAAGAAEIGSFKDRLYSYPSILREEDGGAYRVVDYREARDINARDEVPERRVWPKYVALGVRRQQQDLVAETKAGRIAHVAVGPVSGASLIVIYAHGKGGSRKQGIDDFSFGGNFNRLKNLVVDAGGLYLSPDFSGFDSAGVGEIAALIDFYGASAPGAPVIVACGSMGGAICYGLAAEARPLVSGLILLGTYADETVLASPAVRRRVPVFFGQGSQDRVFAVEAQEELYRRLRARDDYPARFVRFETGTHGTPIRMVDWRETLAWMLSAH